MNAKLMRSRLWLQRLVRRRSPIQKLCVAIAILSDALKPRRGNDRGSRPALGTDGLRASVRLSRCQRELLAALLADEAKRRGIHSATATQGTRKNLLRWIDILTHKLLETPNDQAQAQPPETGVACNDDVQISCLSQN